MRKTTLVIDDELIRGAQAALGTKGIKDTVDRALREAIARQAREHLIDLMTSSRGLDLNDPEVMRQAWR
ncbi:MAG TPA: type II toxin-antitoxin system VapB family antitoxin [Chloroflexota bacterium]|jgi:Arc/MetJ family transcription regulator|nr:type II toxin-antitoxin system VapB family antitoxin [Chloroflexota bacterium]